MVGGSDRMSLCESVVGGWYCECGWRVGWADFGINRGLDFVVGFSVGFLDVRASSADQLLRVIGGSDFWSGRWIRSRESL